MSCSTCLTVVCVSVRVLVGAPRAQTQQPGIVRGGAVYRCGTNISGRALSAYTNCQQIPFDVNGEHAARTVWRRLITHPNLYRAHMIRQGFKSSKASGCGSVKSCAPTRTDVSARETPVHSGDWGDTGMTHSACGRRRTRRAAGSLVTSDTAPGHDRAPVRRASADVNISDICPGRRMGSVVTRGSSLQ